MGHVFGEVPGHDWEVFGVNFARCLDSLREGF